MLLTFSSSCEVNWIFWVMILSSMFNTFGQFVVWVHQLIKGKSEEFSRFIYGNNPKFFLTFFLFGIVSQMSPIAKATSFCINIRSSQFFYAFCYIQSVQGIYDAKLAKLLRIYNLINNMEFTLCWCSEKNIRPPLCVSCKMSNKTKNTTV